MVYIIVLNWNGAKDTLACIDSLINLENVQFRIVICDNASSDGSYQEIYNSLSINPLNFNIVEFNKYDIDDKISISNIETENSIFLIQTGSNLGFSGGNNVGINFALEQEDMDYVWILNNDTIVDPSSLSKMKQICDNNKNIGICGSKLIVEHDRNYLQGLGGVYNSWLGTSFIYAGNMPSSTLFDSEIVSNKIDYVIGASMLLSKKMLNDVGLLSEDYFLYFEELDLIHRARKKGYSQYVATNAIVYHKEGSSAGNGNDRSVFSDMLAIKNRLVFTRKFYKLKLPFVWFGLFFVLFNRIKRKQYKKAWIVIQIMLFIK